MGSHETVSALTKEPVRSPNFLTMSDIEASRDIKLYHRIAFLLDDCISRVPNELSSN